MNLQVGSSVAAWWWWRGAGAGVSVGVGVGAVTGPVHAARTILAAVGVHVATVAAWGGIWLCLQRCDRGCGGVAVAGGRAGFIL